MNLALSFGAPLAFLALLLAIPVVVLYLLKVRRRQVNVAYLRLWESLLLETRARSLFTRLKRWFSLAVQLLLLALLAFALAQPEADLDADREHVVVLLDCSASMQAVEKGGKTRFEQMLERAELLLERRSFEDSYMLVAVSDRVDVLCPFTRNPLRLRDALAKLKPTHRSLVPAQAAAFAREVTQDKLGPSVIFLTDGGAGRVAEAFGLDAETPPEPPVRVVSVGEAAENVGIVRFSARKNTSLGTDYVLAVVKNFGLRQRQVQLTLRMNGVTQKVVPRSLEPGEELTERFQLTLPEGGTLQLELTGEGEDALATDDQAFAIVRPSRLRKVLLVAAKQTQIPAFRVAFGSMREVIDPQSVAVTAAELAELSAEERAADVVICMGVVPPDLPDAGNLILIDTDLPEFLPAKQTGTEVKPQVWDWDREHLLNRYLNFKGLDLPTARVIELTGSDRAAQPLVQSYEGPLITAFESEERRTVYVGFDMSSRLFPFRLAFPMLLRNAIAWFEIEENVLFAGTYPPGGVITPLRRVAGPVEATWFEGGEKRTQTLELDRGRFAFATTEEPGPYKFRIGNEDYATSVNLFDPGESRVAPAGAGEDAPTAEEPQEASIFHRDLWPILVLLGLVLWVVEWGTYHRRVTE